MLFETAYSGPGGFAKELKPRQKPDEAVVVSNPKTPVPKNGIPMRIVFKEDLSIGEAEGDEHYMFGKGIVFNTDEDGNYYVADLENFRIQKYDAKGKYLLTIGRKGQGPGEFASLSSPGFDGNNDLYVSDEASRRISFFDKNGKFLRQIQLKDRYVDLQLNSKGFSVANKWTMYNEAGSIKQSSVFGLFDDNFNLLAELRKEEITTALPTGFDESSLSDFLAKALSLAAFRPYVTYTIAKNDLIYFGYPEKYEIRIYSPNGRLVKKIARDYDPIPVSEEDKADFANKASSGFSAPVYTESVKKKAFQKTKYPSYKPAYQSFALMENGWLAVIVDSLESQYTLFDIYDQDGRYIANFRTTVPAAGVFSRPVFFKNGKAYAVTAENEYQYVKRYGLEIQEYRNKAWVKVR
jgi:hypothetical protein